MIGQPTEESEGSVQVLEHVRAPDRLEAPTADLFEIAIEVAADGFESQRACEGDLVVYDLQSHGPRTEMDETLAEAATHVESPLEIQSETFQRDLESAGHDREAPTDHGLRLVRRKRAALPHETYDLFLRFHSFIVRGFLAPGPAGYQIEGGGNRQRWHPCFRRN